MTDLEQEVLEIWTNATAAFEAGEITEGQFIDATHTPLRDLYYWQLETTGRITPVTELLGHMT